MSRLVSVNDLVKRIIKYLVEGLMVAIAAYAIPKARNALNVEEIMFIALTAAATFSILDTYVPSMGVSARSGAGFGIGMNMVKFPGGF
jgi:ABC-type Co2+ transport system permease subunit